MYNLNLILCYHITDYKETADVFSLGAIFYTILVRSYIRIAGEKYFGGFVSVNGQWYGIGEAMSKSLPFQLSLHRMKRSRKELLLSMLQYDPKERPSAGEVYRDVEDMRRNMVCLTRPQVVRPVVPQVVRPVVPSVVPSVVPAARPEICVRDTSNRCCC